MMKKFAIMVGLMVALVALTSCNSGNEGNGGEVDTNVTYDIFLCIGQSNMSGFGGTMLEEDKEPIANAYQLDNNGEVIPAAAPLNFFSSVRKKMELQQVNPAFQFAKDVAPKNANPILIVGNARGGTSIHQWQKDANPIVFSQDGNDDSWLWGITVGNLFDEAVRRCKQAMEYGELKAILWHQGGGDSNENASARYLDDLKEFVDDLREALGVGAEVPFIAGELYHGHKNSEYFNPVIQTVGDHIEGCYWVSAEGVTVGPDGIHFDRKGQILFGGRYAAKYLEIVEAQKAVTVETEK